MKHHVDIVLYFTTAECLHTVYSSGRWRAEPNSVREIKYYSFIFRDKRNCWLAHIHMYDFNRLRYLSSTDCRWQCFCFPLSYSGQKSLNPSRHVNIKCLNLNKGLSFGPNHSCLQKATKEAVILFLLSLHFCWVYIFREKGLLLFSLHHLMCY